MSYFQCEPEIFKNGVFVKSMGRVQGSDATTFCQEQEKQTNEPHDWFILGDRIIIRKLEDTSYKKKDMVLIRLLVDDMIAEGLSDLKDLSNVIGKMSPLNSHIKTITSSLKLLGDIRNSMMM